MRRRLALGLGAILACAALGATWWSLRTTTREPRIAAHRHADAISERSEPAPGPVDERRSDAAHTSPRDVVAKERPHPITPVHDAMAKRRESIAALKDALEHKQYGRARQLLEDADELARIDSADAAFGTAVHGYRLILACLAAREGSTDGTTSISPELLEESQRYLNEQRLSPRRDVRRVCVEGRPFARRT